MFSPHFTFKASLQKIGGDFFKQKWGRGGGGIEKRTWYPEGGEYEPVLVYGACTDTPTESRAGSRQRGKLNVVFSQHGIKQLLRLFHIKQ